MAKANKEEAKQEINTYIKDNGGAYSGWYVGITSDPDKRLFTDHNVNEKGGQWIYVPCVDSDTARDVESYFIDVKGTAGGPGGGDDDAIFVYAYKITSYTKEDN